MDVEGRVRLLGWKAIASHLGVTEKTARSWELSRGLPVRRQGQGKKRPVVAYVDELDEWLAQDEALPPQRPSRTFRPLAVLSVVVVILALAGWGAWEWSEIFDSPAPERVIVSSTMIEVEDATGETLWTKQFPKLQLETYTLTPDRPGDQWKILDVDGDGNDEVLFVSVPSASSGNTSTLHCLKPGGEPCWPELELNKVLPEDPRIGPSFNGSIIGMVDSPAATFLLVLIENNALYPSCLFLVDPLTGQITQEYCHPGYLYVMELVDLDGDGYQEILCGGINNPGPGLGHPAMMIVNVPFEAARAPGYFSQEFGPSGYVLFPRPDVADVMGIKSRVLGVRHLSSGLIRVRVETEGANMLYDLNPDLSLERFIEGDVLSAQHTGLSLKGRLDHDFEADHEYLNQVRVFKSAPDGNSKEVQALFAR